MIEWTDEAVVLSARSHGEGSAILQFLTRTHGRYAGLVRGGGARRVKGVLQPGNAIVSSWRARLAEHLGTCSVELLRNHWAAWINDADRLSGLDAMCAVAEASLPEREPFSAVYEGMQALLDNLHEDLWPALYVRWEIGLLSALGYGLDLSNCAVTGSNEELIYVSPRSGRAVSRDAGAEYAEKLLPLPAFLVRREIPSKSELVAGLSLTGHFLSRHVLYPAGRDLPPARLRLIDRLQRSIVVSSHPRCE